MIVGASFYLIGLVCIALGLIWFINGKSRIFYGLPVEGPVARVIAIILIAIGVALFGFAYFVLPQLLPNDLFDVLG